jgi:DNA-binding NarL/FixJ family response regulator
MTTPARISVLLVDDQALVRAGFRTLLEHSDDIVVVGEARHGAEAIQLAHEQVPQVVLMDIRMPMMDGIEASRRLMADERTRGCRVVMLTTFEEDDLIFDALRAGACGYLLKAIEPDELRQAVRIAHHGGSLLSPSVARRLIQDLTARTDPRPVHPERLEVLTQREREVLELVGRGMTNEQVGAALFISPATAKTHVNRAMSKLAVSDRAQLVVIAYETGLVDRR